MAVFLALLAADFVSLSYDVGLMLRLLLELVGPKRLRVVLDLDREPIRECLWLYALSI